MDVKIYQPAKTVTQSGRGKMAEWLLEYELATPRKPEPLMGWTASGDTLNQVRLKFDTLEEAVAFADKKGWPYTVLASQKRKVKPRNYGDNFIYKEPEITDSRKDLRREPHQKRPNS